MPPLNSKYISVSGIPTFEQNKIIFPSGEFGIVVSAYLSAMNASFGFNITPHKFDLEYIPENFNFRQLPVIGTEVSFTIGQHFFIRGSIIHSDYNKSSKGKILSISIEDDRLDLNQIVLDTYGVFGAMDAPSTGVVDIRYWYLQKYALTRAKGRSIITKDLFMMDQHGASYRQIYEAIKYFEQERGTISNILSKIPVPEIIETQLPYDPEAYRWKIKGEPLLNALSKILNDISLDFYWNMKESKINVINKKFNINIDEDAIPVANDPAEVTSIRYGSDRGDEPTVVKIFGAQMEGVLCRNDSPLKGVQNNTTLLGNPNGAYGIASGVYDLGIGPNDMKWIPAWRDVIIRYYGPGGGLQEDKITDRNCILALKGIEYWAAENNIENRITVSTFETETGNTVKQSITSDTNRPGMIPNRYIPENSWVIEWYNRVRNFASNYFGRAYKLDPACALYQRLDEFEAISEAWCNLENLSRDGTFQDDYKIQGKYNALAPFWNMESNKIKAFAILPTNTKWGEDGKGTPTQFDNWNECGYGQFVPIEVHQWTNSHYKFEESYVKNIYSDEKGLMIKLPNICWSQINKQDTGLLSNPFLQNVHTLSQGRTRNDFPSPINVGEVYDSSSYPLSIGSKFVIALPVRVKRRYGYAWPSVWSSGTGTKMEVQIQDDLAPWNYEPRGNSNSINLLNNEARSQLSARVVSREYVTFAEASKIGLPIISFDNFANQNLSENGYGIVNHGITSLSLSKSMDWWQTKYSIKSHFPQFIKARPTYQPPLEDFFFAVHRIQTEVQKLLNPVLPFAAPLLFDKKTEPGSESFQDMMLDKFDKLVTISTVGDSDPSNPYYAGYDDHSILWPRGMDSVYNSSSYMNRYRTAYCTDGYLQVGMTAVYHYEDLPDGTFVHYFTGGFPLNAGRIVEITSEPRLLNSIWVSNCRTLPT